MGDSALALRFAPTAVSALEVRAAFRAIQSAQMPEVRNLHPAYASLLIEYDPRLTDEEELLRKLTLRLEQDLTAESAEARHIEIPICYGAEHGPDLEPLAQARGLSVEEVVERHSQAEYRVAFLGFQPGFPYLIGLPPELASPRLASPRLNVPTGSVGIAGNQTGIYPQRSPGGWQLIGRTPLALFHADRFPPTLLEVGDRVTFRPISIEAFQSWRKAVP